MARIASNGAGLTGKAAASGTSLGRRSGWRVRSRSARAELDRGWRARARWDRGDRSAPCERAHGERRGAFCRCDAVPL